MQLSSVLQFAQNLAGEDINPRVDGAQHPHPIHILE
jgi:hypothetical protein